MKATDKNHEKKKKIKKKPLDKSKKQQVVVVAQEIKFARLLSGNEKKTRDRVLRALKKWLINCFEKNYEFKEDDFTRVWKGLFYAVWMSDKPLVQEDLCESIAGILDLFPPERLRGAMLMARAGFKMLATEWFGIDQHRIDKFLMLVRRYLRGSLRCIKRCAWSEDACTQFADMLTSKDGILAVKTPLYARNATSMVMHIADCYLEEISKVSSGDIPPDSLCILLHPFLLYLSQGSSLPLCVASRRVIADLIKYMDAEDESEDGESEQGSDGEGAGTENGDEAGDDGDNGVENGDGDSDDELMEGPLDPRAGRVDVRLRRLPAGAAPALLAALRAALPAARAAGHRRLRTCIANLEQFMSGRNPFDPTVIEIEHTPPAKPGKAARALRVLEKTLVATSDELALRGLGRKHRKRLLAKSRAGHSIVDDIENAKTDKHTNANGDWLVEEAEIKTGKKKRKQANKENEAEPKNKKQKLDETPTVENKVSVKKQKKNKLNKMVESKSIVKDVKVKEKTSVNGQSEVKMKSAKEKVNGKDSVKNVKDVSNVDVKNNVNNLRSTVETVKGTVKDKMKVKASDVKTIKKKLPKESEAKVLVNKIKKFQKQDQGNSSLNETATPKKVKFVLRNNSMQGTLDYYKSVRQSPNIPFDSSKQPSKTNLKVNTPSPINPFFKKKMTRRATFAAGIIY